MALTFAISYWATWGVCFKMALVQKRSDSSDTTVSKSIPKKYGQMKCTCCDDVIPCEVLQYHANSNDSTNVDRVPLHTPCAYCSKWLGHLESDNSDVMSGLCIECFSEEIQDE